MDASTIDTDGKVERKRRFDKRDFDYIAEYICDEYTRRKNARRDREKQWKEVDRQIAMEPDITAKMLQAGKVDPKKAWMAEMELPLQAQALEVLTADARRMMFPDAGSFFRGHAETTDEYLKQDFNIILGDENDVPSLIDQDNADKLAEGFLLHQFRQYDFASRIDRCNAEAFSYGMGVGRARKQTKNVYIHEARGTRVEKQRLPVLIPASIKNVYLDDPMPSMHSATLLGESHISEDYINLEKLQFAANKGSTDPDDEDGGWMPQNVSKLEGDKDGYVKLLEMEGDIVVPRKTVRSIVIPGAIATVALGEGGQQVVRFRFRKDPWSSYILFPYHYESASEAYPTSPLMKGRPVQITAVQALNRFLDSAALKNCPPVSYDSGSVNFTANGGPDIYPGAQWPSPDQIQVHHDVGGDPVAIMQAFSMSVNLYAELTGVLPARLGAQTVSHTTAFAKNAELERGAVRTVHYVRRTGQGPMTRWLDMAYKMGRDDVKSGTTFFINSYGGFVRVNKSHLPEKVSWEWFGSGGPAEEAQKRQEKLNALALAIQMEQVGMAAGMPPDLDLSAAKREVLREGGWVDVDQIVRTTESPTGDQAASGVPGDAGDGTGAALVSLSQIVGNQAG